MFCEDHPIDAISLQMLFDIITSQKELYILIGEGGEGLVYKKGYQQNSGSKAFIPVGSNSKAKSCSPKSHSPEVSATTYVAMKVLKDLDSGGYGRSSPEVLAARDHSRSTSSSPLLTGACVSSIQIERNDPRTIALCMEMGVLSMDTFFSKEKDVGKRLVKAL